MMRFIRLTAPLLCLGALAACNSISEPEGPGMAGSIVARDISTSIGGAPTIHVKGNPSEECGVIFVVRSSTSIFRRTTEGDLVSAPASELTVGRQVVAWSKVVYDTCPGQASADAIEIL